MTRSKFKTFLSRYNYIILIGILVVCSVAYASIVPSLTVSNDASIGNDLTVSNDIIVVGNVDGRDVSADGSTTDNLTITLGLDNFTAAEVTQLQTIDTVTIDNTQWGFLGGSDQAIDTGATPQYAGLLSDTVVNFLEISTPANPATNRWKLYFKSDGFLYKLDEGGIETSIEVASSLDFGQQEILLLAHNGYGSSSTKIPRFSSTTTDVGSDMTLTQSATIGSVVTINTTGVYSFVYCSRRAAGISTVGITINASAGDLTTNVQSVLNGRTIGYHQNAAAQHNCVQGAVRLVATDVVRPHDDGNNDATAPNNAKFRAVRVH